MDETTRWSGGAVGFGSTMRDEARLQADILSHVGVLPGLKGEPLRPEEANREAERLAATLAPSPSGSSSGGLNRRQRRALARGGRRG